ncbi:YbaB/EbfC family nucleoid-associated protein [Streptomyces sp. NBC_00555]|uniref:YbaB/EbfC family nucleoid-associated protein n=1 Tax=Streptomyces sp. NBC_00555 TaxID=2903662 RepID=UPI00225269C1|nr:YbaB/EbfC family nucleoid-associated protein [Streptomyces sp. NBC_00555]MCX5015107.1 YbaB/EbfC family nucleoid-associated protein [Streptomyces sp. NBC_00555]
MGIDFEGKIKDAMSALHEQRDRMLAAKRDLDSATASATSKDRMVSVTVGPQGQVVSMTFHTKAYQAMAPAELSAALVTVLNDARATMGAQVIERIKGFDNFGEHLRMVTGLTGMPDDLDELMKPLRAMGSSFGLEEASEEAKAAKQEEFAAEEEAARARSEHHKKQEEFAAESESRIPTGKQEVFNG